MGDIKNENLAQNRIEDDIATQLDQHITNASIEYESSNNNAAKLDDFDETLDPIVFSSEKSTAKDKTTTTTPTTPTGKIGSVEDFIQNLNQYKRIGTKNRSMVKCLICLKILRADKSKIHVQNSHSANLIAYD